jgi:hypothetical protein
MINVPAPVPKAPKTNPDTKNLPGNSGKERTPRLPPTKNKKMNMTAKTTIVSALSIIKAIFYPFKLITVLKQINLLFCKKQNIKNMLKPT